MKKGNGNGLFMYMYIYICIYVYVFIYTCVYIYIFIQLCRSPCSTVVSYRSNKGHILMYPQTTTASFMGGASKDS